MPLTGTQLSQIHDMILPAYDRDGFRQAVRKCMDGDFDAHAPNAGFSDQLWAFLTWANRQDRALEALQCACTHNQGNTALAALWQAAKDWQPAPLFSAASIIERNPGGIAPIPASIPVAISRVTLPPQNERFVGRTELLDEIRRRMQTPGAFAITSLRGAAGVGKSALALEAAYRFANLFPDGRYWLDLRGGDAVQVLRTLLLELGVTNSEQLKGDLAALVGLVRGQLAGQRVLLVLDNAESIARTNPQHVKQMCLPVPACTLITTRIATEAGDLRVDVLSDEEALALLAANGIDVAGQQDEARALAERLGNLALALDITARRMLLSLPVQSCADALKELNSRSNVLDALKIPRRHNVDDNVGESYAVSYEMLDADLQAAFHALGQCAPSGAPVAGVAAMLEVDEYDARDLLRALAMVSLADFDGKRAELHPLLYEYAGVCARRAPKQVQAMQVRHVRYFGDEIGGAYQRALESKHDIMPSLHSIDQEIDNVELAQELALIPAFPDPRLAVAITDYLSQVWNLRQLDKQKCISWLSQGASIAQEYGHVRHHANCVRAIADVQYQLSDYHNSRIRFDEALRIYQSIADRIGEASCIQSLGNVHLQLGEYAKAKRCYETALQIFRNVNNYKGEADCTSSLGELHIQFADYQSAGECFERSLQIFRKTGEQVGQANCLRKLGNVNAHKADYQEAMAQYSAALLIFRQLGDRQGEAICLRKIGEYYISLGDNATAQSYIKAALTMIHELGDRLGEAICIKQLGKLSLALGDYVVAQDQLSAALHLFREIRANRGIADCLRDLGEVDLQQEKYHSARVRFEEALKGYNLIGHRLGEANCYRDLARTGLAPEYFDRALTLHAEIGSRDGVAFDAYYYGLWRRDRGELDSAATLLRQASALFGEIGIPLRQAEIDQLLDEI
jgi:tetratricopeptide (TPR) repeat protein